MTLIAETFIASLSRHVEWGFTFKEPGSDDEVLQLVIGGDITDTGKAESDYARFQWAADAIVKASEKEYRS